MRPLDRFLKAAIGLAFLAIGLASSAAATAAQDADWRVVEADYGFRNQRTDVTNLLRDLLRQGGVNGRIAVNNQTMGGDPAVGKDKTLRVFAKNSGDESREFDYVEGGFIPVGLFIVGRDDDRDDRHDDRGNYGGRFHEDHDDVGIVRAFYGVQGRTVNVTDLLQRMLRRGVLSLNVNNRAMGGDPAVGADKVLIVIYTYRGQEQAVAVPEGGTLSIP